MNYSINKNKKRGAMSLEITLVMPILMILMFAFIWQISSIRNEAIYKSIVFKESEKVALTGIALELLGQTELASKLIDDNNKVADMVMETTYELALTFCIKQHYNTFISNKHQFTKILQPICGFVERDVTDDVLYYTSMYSLNTPFGKKTKKITIPARTWYRGDHSGKLLQTLSSNVWEMDNFERGRMMRTHFGGNLPFGYPVLSGYTNHSALVIKSMDLTKKTWNNPEEVFDQLRSELNDFKAFDGTKYPWGKNAISILSGDIHDRHFKLIVPDNIDSIKYKSTLNQIIAYSNANEIRFEIVYYQKSCE